MSKTPPKELIHFVKCMAGVKHADELLKSDNADLADEWFSKTLGLATSAPPEVARDLVPYTLCLMSKAYERRGLDSKASETRERAATLLDQNHEHLDSAFTQTSIAKALIGLRDFRRAIPFLQGALKLADHEDDPMDTAQMLHQLGDCYCRIGLRDHAVIPLRAALKIFEAVPEHPMRPSLQLSLGNALRKSSPSEAEACYRAGADYHASRLQFESATPAWSNLAILCSEQGRHTESLEFYDKVLRTRTQIPDVDPAKIARVHNNIACAYRRMGEFQKGLESVDRAISMNLADGKLKSSTCSTRAMILRDAGRDAEAVEWYQKAFEARKEQVSPDLEEDAKDLESTIALLMKLGRTDEAELARAALSETQMQLQRMGQPSEMQPTSGVQTATLFIELAYARKQRKTSGVLPVLTLIEKLNEALESEEAGQYSGDVLSPENTTLIYSGADAEKLNTILEPLINGEPICAGARITIRQGDFFKEWMVPHASTGLN